MQERARLTRNKLLKAARHSFARSGFHGSRVDAIAARAGANKERLYAYFGSKKGLFAAVLEDAFSEMVKSDNVLESLEQKDIPMLPQKLIQHYVRFHEKHAYFWRLLSWENLEGGKHLDALRGIRDPVYQNLRKLYSDGQKQGLYRRNVSFESFIFVITAVTFFYFANQKTMSRTLGKNLSDSKVRGRMLSEIARLISFEVGEKKCR